MRRQLYQFFWAASVVTMSTGAGHAAVNLPALNIDKTQTTVSGLSSGGFMAVQLHVAYSATFKKGAGVVAGGPYYCAEGVMMNATGRCMASPAGINTTTLVNTTNNWATQGLIDPVANLQESKVYLFAGTLDSTVKPGVMNALQTYYKSFVPEANIVYKNNIAAEHAMITDDYGSTCATNGTPYINNCNFDLAGNILSHLYGTLNARNAATLPETNFVEFNQSQFITNHGMATTGWVYIPQTCQDGNSCRLHVVMHGCKQNTNDIQQRYVRNTGYNRWADTNNIVILYPQTGALATNSCWDWWGYDSANYAKKSGPQMTAIKAMVDQLSSGSGSSGGGGGTTPPADPLPAPTGLSTSNASDSSMTISWSAVTNATGYHVYRNNNKVNATTLSSTSYTDTGLSPATQYSWSVRTVNSAGTEGAASTAISASTTGATVSCYTSNNYAHTTAGRATQIAGITYAHGSNQNMGLWNTFVTTTLKMTGPNYYVIGTCP